MLGIHVEVRESIILCPEYFYLQTFIPVIQHYDYRSVPVPSKTYLQNNQCCTCLNIQSKRPFIKGHFSSIIESNVHLPSYILSAVTERSVIERPSSMIRNVNHNQLFCMPIYCRLKCCCSSVCRVNPTMNCVNTQRPKIRD